jgi:hypothetical protein
VIDKCKDTDRGKLRPVNTSYVFEVADCRQMTAFCCMLAASRGSSSHSYSTQFHRQWAPAARNCCGLQYPWAPKRLHTAPYILFLFPYAVISSISVILYSYLLLINVIRCLFNILDSWNITPSTLVNRCNHFGKTYCVHVQYECTHAYLYRHIRI